MPFEWHVAHHEASQTKVTNFLIVEIRSDIKSPRIDTDAIIKTSQHHANPIKSLFQDRILKASSLNLQQFHFSQEKEAKRNFWDKHIEQKIHDLDPSI